MGVVIVTGAFGALGTAVVSELAAQGDTVVAVDRAPAPAAFDGALALGGVDLAEEAEVSAAYLKAVERFGGLDGLVNIAGGFVWESFEEGSLESFDRMYRINLRTAANSCRCALPHLLVSRGAVVNVGAAAAVRAGAGMAPYAASKAGVLALTESLADECRSTGVRVNAVLPTIIDTVANRESMPDADTSAWVRPQAAAKVVAFLLSPAAGAVTGSGVLLSLAG